MMVIMPRTMPALSIARNGTPERQGITNPVQESADGEVVTHARPFLLILPASPDWIYFSTNIATKARILVSSLKREVQEVRSQCWKAMRAVLAIPLETVKRTLPHHRSGDSRLEKTK
jgi:hypothetical protein